MVKCETSIDQPHRHLRTTNIDANSRWQEFLLKTKEDDTARKVKQNELADKHARLDTKSD